MRIASKFTPKSGSFQKNSVVIDSDATIDDDSSLETEFYVNFRISCIC